MITLTFLGTTVTLSSLTLVLLGIGLLAALFGLLWVLNNYLNQQAVQRSQRVMKSIVPQMKVDYPVAQSHRAWVEALLENNLLTPLFSPGRHIILGTPEMGSTAILSYVLATINSAFGRDGRMCIYVDIGEVARPTKGMGYVSIEDVYRSILLSGVQQPVQRLRMQVSKSSFQRSGLGQMLNEIEGILKNSLTRMSPLDVRQSTVQVWKRLGVREVIFAIENVTQLDPATIPVFLGLLQQTFGRMASVSYIISGDPSTLILNKKTADGSIGVQVSHDVSIALNLPDLLISQPGLGREDHTVRLDYLTNLLWLFGIKKASGREIASVRGLFSPPEAWKLIFDQNHGNLVEIAASFKKLIDHYTSTNQKIDLKILRRILPGDFRKIGNPAGGNYA
jgi:hypothetical protein